MDQGLENLPTDLLRKIEHLKEYGVGIDSAIPVAFDIVNQNYTLTDTEIKERCWEFIPEEDKGGDSTDPYYFTFSDEQQGGLSKRELFILNSDEIEVMFLDIVRELVLNLSGGFNLVLENEFNDIRLVTMDEGTTCIRCWK